MFNIEDITKNKDIIKKKHVSLNLDSVFLEQNGNIEKRFYKDEFLHEVRSCAKILVAFAIGIAIDKGLAISGGGKDIINRH